jgi:AMMECR1 domain-containing protein
MHFRSENDLLAQLRPGVDGLILEEGFRRGTFLPSVWEQLPEAKAFLHHLKLKAGLPVNYWSATISISRYTTHGFGTTFKG